MADAVLRLDPEIVIGVDTLNRAGALCGRLGRKVLVATEHGLYENNLIERLVRILEDAGLETILFDEIPSQATAEAAENAASLARGARCDMVLGFGSQKTLYTARLTSLLAASRQKLFDIMDSGREEETFLPYTAISTAGCDPFIFSDYLVAVDPRDRFAKLIKCPRTHCKAVILDPGISELANSKAGSIAVFDGLCVSLEAYCSVKSSFFSDAILEQAISLYAEIIHSYADNKAADFAAASTHAAMLMAVGSSLSIPGLGTALAYAINGKFPVAKSWCATVLLPYVMEKLVAVRPEKMAKAASIMDNSIESAGTAESANMGIEFVRRCMGQLSVPARLKDFNLSLDRLVPVAEAARNLEFVASSPWTVSTEDAYDLLKQAY
jgi:alcohol dehydrogenase